MADKSKIKVHTFWGRTKNESGYVNAIGRSGGLISFWDPQVLVKRDVFNLCFVKRYWDFLKPDFIGLFTHFHDHGELSPCFFAAFIALIPKAVNPQTPNEWALILNETVSWLKKSNGRGMILKLDIAKAFNSYLLGLLGRGHVIDGFFE